MRANYYESMVHADPIGGPPIKGPLAPMGPLRTLYGRSEGLPRAGYFIPAHVGDGGGVGWGCSAVVVAVAGGGRGHMRKYWKIPPIPALGHLPKSKKHLFGEVPKRRRQLGGTEKLGFSKKHLLGGVPKRRRQLGGTKKLGIPGGY